MNRLLLGSDAGAQGDVHGYINTGLHTVSAAQGTQDMARLDGTTSTILEGPLVRRNVRFVVAVGVGEATQAGPLPRLTASPPRQGSKKSPMLTSGGKK